MAETDNMLKVTIKGKTYLYQAGTPYSEIASDMQKDYPNDILLVNRSGKLRELHKKLNMDCTLDMITAKDRPGIQTYERSAVLLFLKSFYDTVGVSNIDRVNVDFSTCHGLFIRAFGNFTLNQELLDKVEQNMHSLADLKLPILKRSVATDEAIDIFHRHRMFDKERLFRFRLSSRVNIYSLGGFEDYFYGYMVQNTGYIRCFKLQIYKDGLVLRLPSQENPTVLPEFLPSEKVFNELHRSTVNADRLNLGNVGCLNEAISSGNASDLILTQEALMEKKIGDIAQEIIRRKGIRFIMIAGPSSSGKTTFSHRLSTQLSANGLKPHAIEVDNYFKNRADTPKDKNGQYDFECLEAMDVELFNHDMQKLLAGERVEIPHFNFKMGEREYRGDFLSLGESDILVIEGIHCLNDRLSYSLPKESKYRIYISCLTQLNIDEHNRISTTDARLLRRIERDARTRGTSARNTLKMWPSVRRGEERNIFPFQESADVVFNSALIYETALLKPYIEPLLFGIPKDCEEYIEAKRLLKFLDYFLTIPSDDVPKTSILREFIGGSCYNV